MMNDHRGEFNKILSNQDGEKSKTAGGSWEAVIIETGTHGYVSLG
jgi:hypothetical protein